MLLSTPPELVIFDVDGTLQNTFRWWPRVIREGLHLAAKTWGFECPPVDDDHACSVVGFKGIDVWGAFLPAEHRDRWIEFREMVVPIEVAELYRGVDYLFDGVRTLLTHLRERGIRVATASNCGHRYYKAVLEGQGLGDLTDWQFCLDSAGGVDKTGMLHLAMEAAGTTHAVMVGDREPDQQAARAAGLPFVWRVSERFPLAGADAHWHGDPDELLGLLGLPAIS